MNSYESKLEARKARIEARAERLAQEGAAKVRSAKERFDVIPFGQPIHGVRDRNYREKARNMMGNGYKLLDQADKVAERAATVGTGGISSDDPDAIAKLKGKLADCEASQEFMRAGNKLIRKVRGLPIEEQVATLKRAGIDPKRLGRDFAGRIGFADYELSNNSAEIRRLKGRIADLEERQAVVEKTDGAEMVKAIGDIKIIESPADNRIRIVFPGKPSSAIISELKSSGFRWSPTNGAWQLHLSNAARWKVERIVEMANAA